MIQCIGDISPKHRKSHYSGPLAEKAFDPLLRVQSQELKWDGMNHIELYFCQNTSLIIERLSIQEIL